MEVRLRTTRTLKVTEVRIGDEERRMLAQLHDDARYQALLDVMERACIELETSHLNTGVGDPEAVLGGHLLAKASWLFFQYVQRQVLFAKNAAVTDEQPVDEPSLNDVIQGVEGIPAH